MSSNSVIDTELRGSCCPAGSMPHLREDPSYINRGEMVQYHHEGINVNAYLVGKGNRCIVLIHDIFGLHSGHNKRVCDILAQRLPETIVIAPNFFPTGTLQSGSSGPTGQFQMIMTVLWSVLTFRTYSFLRRNRWEGAVDGILNATIQHACTMHGVEQFGLLGFCWGGYMNVKACICAAQKEKILCAMSCHPSIDQLAWLLGDGDDLELIRNLNCPQFILTTPQDGSKYYPSNIVEDIIRFRERAKDPTGVAPQSEFYHSSQYHGFMTRGDLNDPAIIEEVELNIGRICSFFNKCCKL